MRHGKKRLQLNRFTSWHRATLISLAKSLLVHQSIKTTLHRAKAAKSMVEKLISLAKSNTLSARRRAFQILGSHKLVTLLFKEIGPRFANRTGGYTRIIGLGKRRGDNAETVIFELTEIKKKEIKKPKKEKAETEKQPEKAKEELVQEKKEEKKPEPAKERPPISKKPSKKFLGGIRNIFKKERDSL